MGRIIQFFPALSPFVSFVSFVVPTPYSQIPTPRSAPSQSLRCSVKRLNQRWNTKQNTAEIGNTQRPNQLRTAITPPLPLFASLCVLCGHPLPA